MLQKTTIIQLTALFIERSASVFVAIFLWRVHLLRERTDVNRDRESWYTLGLVIALLLSFMLSLSVLLLDLDDDDDDRNDQECILVS